MTPAQLSGLGTQPPPCESICEMIYICKSEGWYLYEKVGGISYIGPGTLQRKQSRELFLKAFEAASLGYEFNSLLLLYGKARLQ